MIGKVTRGADFAGLARYLTGQKERVAFVELRNVASKEVRESAREMQITAELSTRCRKPVYHISLAFDVGDRPDEAQLRAASDRVLKALELSGHQALVVGHRDKAHAHVHVMVNRVHADTGKAWSASHDYRRIERVLRELEREWGLRQVPGRHARSPGVPPPARRQKTFAMVLRQKIGAELRQTQSWAEYRACLARYGLHLKRRPRGMVLSDGRQYAAAGRVSESLPALERRFGETLDKNRARRLDARLSDRPARGRVVLYRVHAGHVAAMERFLKRPDEEMMRQLVRWAERQMMRAVLQALDRSAPTVQRVVREARQHARIERHAALYRAASDGLWRAARQAEVLPRAIAYAERTDRRFAEELNVFYVNPDQARAVFYRTAERHGPDGARNAMVTRPREFGRRRLRTRMQRVDAAARMGQRAAAARQALPADLQKSVRDTAVWQGRMDQLQGFAPVQPARNTAQLGAALERLPELQQALAKQVLGAELTQRLAIALRVERQWERGKTQERGLEL